MRQNLRVGKNLRDKTIIHEDSAEETYDSLTIHAALDASGYIHIHSCHTSPVVSSPSNGLSVITESPHPIAESDPCAANRS